MATRFARASEYSDSYILARVTVVEWQEDIQKWALVSKGSGKVYGYLKAEMIVDRYNRIFGQK